MELSAYTSFNVLLVITLIPICVYELLFKLFTRGRRRFFSLNT